MDFLNANFVSMRDLDSIDDKLNALSDQKLRISRAIDSATGADSAEVTDKENLYIEGLLTSIQQLSTAGTESIVENLIERNGNLQVLVDLKEAVVEKNILQSQNVLLRDAALLESAILSLSETSDISELLEISKKLGKFDGTAVGLTLAEELTKVVEDKKAKLIQKLTSLLQLIKWLAPKENVSIASSTLKEISSIFDQLVNLQVGQQVPEYPETWWGLEVLLQPFAMRFNYHFNQSNETNKISRPEWALQFVETFLYDNMQVLELVIGDTFQKHGKIGVMEVLTAALIPVRSKLLKMAQIINQSIARSGDDATGLERNGRLLSHLIFETTSFDQRLRNAYKYNPYITDLKKAPKRKWMGLTGDILLENDEENTAVTNWLNLELRLAKQRFDEEIMDALNAFEIDFEYNASSKQPDILKPSYSAYALVKLFDNLTSHFKTLSIVKYQLMYVSNIQLTFLDEYLQALQKQFGHFNESLSLKLISNFLPGSVKADTSATSQSVISNGLKGLEILTGLYCLIKFVIEQMQEWSEDLLFIQLWNSYRSVSTKKEAEDSIFGSAIAQYTALLDKVATRYADFFKREIRGGFKEYVNSSVWTIDDFEARNLPSVKLAALASIIPTYMAYLERTLPEIDYFLVASKVCDSFSTVVLEYIITNNKFNKNGLVQLQLDLDYLVESFSGPLLMDPQCKYSNADNRKFKKVIQSIEMMEHFDGATARLMKRDVESNDTIRSQFENRLDCLEENDIRDLLFRII
ncbi:CIC11C00000003749 [Sungouiella intermedia]|uniref:CIC11C00000003749 n=1 Tax=Sungouiella intermedia TaxID=45354 RepID=A0A1L0BLT5_9ASCO|nr:CIC11C00000003749 [[Candida] intermedia]